MDDYNFRTIDKETRGMIIVLAVLSRLIKFRVHHGSRSRGEDPFFGGKLFDSEYI